MFARFITIMTLFNNVLHYESGVREDENDTNTKKKITTIYFFVQKQNQY